MMFDVGCLIFDAGKEAGPPFLRNPTRKRGMSCEQGIPRLRVGLREIRSPSRTSKIKHPTSNIPRGISLIEILVSIFVLLFGLMGVAAVFPVGNHYVIEGEKHDLGSSLAQNAFEELVARGMLLPKAWYYATQPDDVTLGTRLIDSTTELFLKPVGLGAGHAFILDPLAAAEISIPSIEREYFPWNANALVGNPWNPSPSNLSGTLWPVRRLTVLQTSTTPFTTPVAETIFRLRDDLAVEQPEQGDLPSIQSWDVDDKGTTDPTDDTPLRRQYKGDYSWLATIVPTSGEALDSLQPEAFNHDPQASYEVSVVVFRRREVAPSATSERLIEAEMLNDGEIAIYAATKELVDAAVEDIREGNWIAIAGVNQTTGDFALNWYRILSMDKETSSYSPKSGGSPQQGRFLTIDGPDWPAPLSSLVGGAIVDLRTIILPGVISVVTHQMTMEE